MSKYFGTDGIRGKAYLDITVEFVEKIGNALAVLGNPRVIVGMDTRESSPVFKNVLVNTLKNAGFSVFDLNITSTPCLIYLTKVFNTLGVMITASHNPYDDNGIKIMDCGKKLNQEKIEILEGAIGKKLKVESVHDISFFSIYDYLKAIKNFNIKKDYKVAFDFANGSLSYIYKDVMKFYDFRKTYVGCSPDGKNINQKCGSLYPDLLKQTVNLESCDVGFAFDGDGDRLIAVDKEGNIYDGDHLIYIIANYYKSKKKLANNAVVLTEDVNPGVAQSFILEKQIDVYKSKVGDRNVREKMDEVGAVIGGETSGHIILSKLSPTGDGLMTALFVLQILSETGKTLKELSESLTFFNILRENFPDFDDKYVGSVRFQKEIEEIKKSVQDNQDALILVRKSGTQHLLRVTVSTGDDARDKEIMKKIKEISGATK